MSEQLVNFSDMHTENFVDRANRRFGIRDQFDVDDAARQISRQPTQGVDVAAVLFGKPTGGGNSELRARLVEMARSRGFTVPVAFAREAIRYRIDRKEFGWNEKPIEPADVEHYMLTEAGRAMLLKEYGIKATTVEATHGGSATFSEVDAGGEQLSEHEHNRLLASTDRGRDLLYERGMRASDIQDLARSWTS